MERSEDTKIVIVGGGICGLSTALALHRKGIRSLVLEKSEKLRGEGAAIIVQTNGWRALHHLALASSLRSTALRIHRGKFIALNGNEAKEIPFRVCEEFRCLKRIDLMEAMANNLPVGTIRTASHVLSIQFDSVTKYHHLLLSNGTVLQAKVVIGCDGVNSMIGKMIGLKETQHSMISKDSKLVRQSLMESMEGFPQDAMEMIENCELNSLHLTTDLKYRPPLDLLLHKFRKGTLIIAGDAMHATG
ncbi:monooxygenase 1-like [Senna tora]|uniref:Monooxygenase 1-like n=1 Tax=Senna tora TaxID=362788 RepID=A0A834TMB5_9FABA|nr:monooxygenase 1-like [Senna tora]